MTDEDHEKAAPQRVWDPLEKKGITSNAVFAAIQHLLVTPPDSKCWIWVGYVQSHRGDGKALHEVHGRRVDVKAFLRGELDGVNRAYRSTCGSGKRCVRPEHQEIRREWGGREVGR